MSQKALITEEESTEELKRVKCVLLLKTTFILPPSVQCVALMEEKMVVLKRIVIFV